MQPSFEEGFGMPVLEAMTLGVPVVAADRGALPEVLGDAGPLVDPDNPDQLAAAIERLIDDDAFAAACASKGVMRARQFSWDAMARDVYSTYGGHRAAMRIGIDARELCGRATGVGPLSRRAPRGMGGRREPRRHEFVLYAPAADRHAARCTPLRNAGGQRLARHLVGAGASSAERRRRIISTVFAPAYTAPLHLPSRPSLRSTICRSWPIRSGSGSRGRSAAAGSRDAQRRRQAVVTISEFSRGELIDRLGVAASKIHVIPPGITNPSIRHPQCRNAIVLFVGSIFNRRHLPDLIRAFAPIARAHPTPRSTSSATTAAFRTRSAATIARAGLDGRVRWHEYVTDES